MFCFGVDLGRPHAEGDSSHIRYLTVVGQGFGLRQEKGMLVNMCCAVIIIISIHVCIHESQLVQHAKIILCVITITTRKIVGMYM